MEKKVKFEDKIKELENIINDLETGEIDLDESINKYSEAMKLVKECDQRLNDIEKQVSKIILENGQEEDFNVED